MKTYFAVFVLLIFIVVNYGQREPNNADLETNDLINSNFSKNIPNSAVLVTVGGSFSPQQKHGTGFLLVRRDDEGAEDEGKKPCRSNYDEKGSSETVPCRILLVTNKHVLPPEANNSPVFLKVNNFTETKKAVRDFEIQLFDDVGRYLPKVKFNPRGYDIAVVDVTQDLDKNQLTNIRILSTSILAVQSKPPIGLRALPATLGDSVYILGYPVGIYDPRTAYPILRLGIIATDPQNKFEFNARLRQKYGFPAKIDGFLIDAAIFPGSSGSLVLRKPINNEFPYSPYAVGIISDSIPIDDEELKSEQRIGLAVVYSSDAIIETMALFKLEK